MAHPITSRRRASAFASALFFVGLAILVLYGTWWPGIMLVIGIPLALRQGLLGHFYDTIITLFIFTGVFVIALYNVGLDILLPVLFVVAAIFILMREFQESREHPEDKEDEDLNHEIEEKEAEDNQKKNKKQ